MFSKKLTGIFSIRCSTKTEAIDDVISDYEDGISRNISYQNISMKFIQGDGGLKKNINIYFNSKIDMEPINNNFWKEGNFYFYRTDEFWNTVWLSKYSKKFFVTQNWVTEEINTSIHSWYYEHCQKSLKMVWAKKMR